MSNETELSDEEIAKLFMKIYDQNIGPMAVDVRFSRAVIAAAFAKRDAAVEPHLRTLDGKIILFPCESNVLLVDDDEMELVSVYSGEHTRCLDVYEKGFVSAALNSNTHPKTR